ncbi:MAG: hypothetical protein ACP5H2_09970 [Solirubrobacteraceae bacterium]
MKRVTIVLLSTVFAVLAVPAFAPATQVQVGVTKSPLVSPVCPVGVSASNCTIVLTQVTAFETRRDGVKDPTTIKQSGVISSFSVGLAGTKTITGSDISYLDKTYGGPPEVQLTALASVGTPGLPSYRVAAQTPVYRVRSQLGNVAEIPLTTPLPVVRGEILALTVPTWAPVLSFDLSTTQFSYSQSRKHTRVSSGSSCNTSAGANLAQEMLGELSYYTCVYAGTRVEYSALEIATPVGLSSAERRRRR